MSAVMLPCGHEATVDHVRGDRRVQCVCGGVAKVTAKPLDGVAYDVTDLNPPPEDEPEAA